MQRLKMILASTSAETLIEVVVSFLIITIALLSFGMMVTFGANLNMKAANIDSKTNAAMATSGSISLNVGAASSTATTYSVTKSSNGSISAYSAS